MGEVKPTQAIEFTPHKHQQEVLDALHEQILVVAGHRAGKSCVGAVWFIQRIAEDIKAGIKADYLVLGPTYRILTQSTLKTLFTYWPKGLGSYKKQESLIQLANGGVVWIRSADKPDAVEGMKAKAAWMDEAALCNETTYDKVCQRLVQSKGESKGRLLMTTTPYGSPSSWMNKRLIEQRAALPYLFYINFSMADNPFIDRMVYDRAKATMNESLFQRDFEGRFVKIEGLIYPEFDRDEHVVDAFEIPGHWPKWSGLDYGWTDPTAILGFAFDPEGKEFYVYKEFYKNRQLAQVIGNFLKQEMFTYTIYDPAAVAVMNEVRTVCKLRIEPADNDVDVGIQRITKLLKEKRVKIFDTCENLIRELEGYCYEKAPANGKTPKPAHECSHSPDALRYGFSKNLAGIYDLVRVGGIGRISRQKSSGFDPLDMNKKPALRKAEKEPNELFEYKSFTSIAPEDD